MRIPVLLLAAVAVAMVGCSPSRAPSSAVARTSAAAASTRAQALPVWRDFVACMRGHGVPQMPDPQVDDKGQADFPNFNPRQIPAAAKQCERILDRLPATAQKDGHPDLTEEQLATLRRFAGCMRTHGQPHWPDPRADGVFVLPAAVLNQGKPALLRLVAPCRSIADSAGGYWGFTSDVH
jgi:hypothetical protein